MGFWSFQNSESQFSFMLIECFFVFQKKKLQIVRKLNDNGNVKLVLPHHFFFQFLSNLGDNNKNITRNEAPTLNFGFMELLYFVRLWGCSFRHG